MKRTLVQKDDKKKRLVKEPVIKASSNDEMDEVDSDSDAASASEINELDSYSSSVDEAVPNDERPSPGASSFEEGATSDDEEMDSQSENSGVPPSDLLADKARAKEIAQELDEKMKKRGVLYMGSVPPRMNVSKLRELLSQYGELCRIYLEPDLKGAHKRGKNTATVKHGQRYLEGWVEFGDKKIAKRVAASFNNTEVGGKRRSPYYGSLWNLKYLHRFKWNHLTERLAHEKMTRQHRLRQEISQAKRQSNFFTQNVEKSKMLEKLQAKKAGEGKDFAPLKSFEVPQKMTDAEIRSQKSKPKVSVKRLAGTPGISGSGISKTILASLFPGK